MREWLLAEQLPDIRQEYADACDDRDKYKAKTEELQMRVQQAFIYDHSRPADTTDPSQAATDQEDLQNLEQPILYLQK